MKKEPSKIKVPDCKICLLKAYKEPSKHCKMCEEIIKGKPIIHDDYHFCSSECLGMYVSDKIEPEKDEFGKNCNSCNIKSCSSRNRIEGCPYKDITENRKLKGVQSEKDVGKVRDLTGKPLLKISPSENCSPKILTGNDIHNWFSTSGNWSECKKKLNEKFISVPDLKAIIDERLESLRKTKIQWTYKINNKDEILTLESKIFELEELKRRLGLK